jgi:hypothetical protein
VIPAKFNNRPTDHKRDKIRPLPPPLLGVDGEPIYLEPVRVRIDSDAQHQAQPEPPPFVGRCYECGTRTPARVGGVCAGGCEVLRPLTCADIHDEEDTPCSY